MLRYTIILFLCIFISSCSNSPTLLEKSSKKYKYDRDYASLEVIYDKLFEGMPRNQVERLLGDPDYSPIEGQYYYSSSRSEYSEDQDKDVTVGIVVDYNDDNGVTTKKLQSFWMGAIGE